MIKDMLVGCTGFVGKNLAEAHTFVGTYHSTNIQDAYGRKPELLVYAGVPSEMFLANNHPDADHERILQSIENIRKIEANEVVLISTVAVYDRPKLKDESSSIDMSLLSAYGAHRLELENWVTEHCDRSLVVRLPALYGIGLKKNFLCDYLTYIPKLLKTSVYNDFSLKESFIGACYEDRRDGFYCCRTLTAKERITLKACFYRLKFSALNFTDSRSVYQFYNLQRLWNDIETARKAGIRKLNLATPPVKVSDIYHRLTGEIFVNELAKQPFDYDIRTEHSLLFGRQDGYIMSREEEINDIISFIRAHQEP